MTPSELNCNNFYVDAFREGSYTDAIQITYDCRLHVDV